MRNLTELTEKELRVICALVQAEFLLVEWLEDEMIRVRLKNRDLFIKHLNIRKTGEIYFTLVTPGGIKNEPINTIPIIDYLRENGFYPRPESWTSKLVRKYIYSNPATTKSGKRLVLNGGFR